MAENKKIKTNPTRTVVQLRSSAIPFQMEFWKEVNSLLEKGYRFIEPSEHSPRLDISSLFGKIVFVLEIPSASVYTEVVEEAPLVVVTEEPVEEVVPEFNRQLDKIDFERAIEKVKSANNLEDLKAFAAHYGLEMIDAPFLKAKKDISTKVKAILNSFE